MLQHSQLTYQLNKEGFDETERQWAINDLTRMPVREAMALAPHLRNRALVDADGQLAVPVFYRCRHYDEGTKSCTNYDGRPDVCRDFPWYGQEPHPAKTLPPGCGYWEDIPLGRKPYRPSF